VFTRLINRNTTIPTKKSQVFSTAADSQTQVGIKVLQGEREMASDNTILGQFDLVGIPPAPRGVPQIEVTFDIDANGLVNVTARDKATGKEQRISIQSSGGLSKDQIEKMIKDSEQFAESDKKRKEGIEAKNEAESLCYNAEKTLSEYKDKVSKEIVDEVNASIADLRAVISSEDAEQIRSKIAAVQAAQMKIGEAINKQGTGGGSSSSGSSDSSEGSKDDKKDSK
jgi:molecular chaperone DnaK (HSP70)